MVLLHLLRCQRFLWRGLRDNAKVSHILYGAAPLPADAPTAVVPLHAVRAAAAAIAANGGGSGGCGPVRRTVWPWMRRLPPDPAFCRFMAQPITIPVYCGLRMVDELGHVNNAKYLEITEFARWHQLSFLGIGHTMMTRQVAFVVSDVSITYQREIKPFSKVWVRTRFVLPPDAPSSPAPAAATAATATGAESSFSTGSAARSTAAAADKKRFFVEHEIWSHDGQKLHASLTMLAALIGPVKYEEELARRYGSVDAAPATSSGTLVKPQRPRTTLDCEQALADVCGFATTAEVRQLFAHVGHVCTPTESGPDAAAAAGAAEDTERTERMRTLAQVWRTSRSVLRRKSLVPKPKKDA